MLWMIFWWLPIDISQGPVAKTIFIHVPLAWCSMIAICVVAISSILYLFTKKTFKHNIYNVGFENFSILKIAEKIKKRTNAKIIRKKSIDIRSYRQDSSRLMKTGFRPKFNVEYAIDELIEYFSHRRKNDFGDQNFNLIKMKQLNVR